MIPIPKGRLVIVHNPHSSRADEVKRKVFDRLDNAGFEYKKLKVQQASLADNVAKLSPQIESSDVIISAAGDGSAHALFQAVMVANKDDVTVGFLAFGNFNDLPHTFTSNRYLQDPIEFLRLAHQETVYPLTVKANGRLVRYALLYATIGWTARAAGQFDIPTVRRSIQNNKVNLVSTLWRTWRYYLKVRRNSYLPPFNYDNALYTHQTDILCVNGPIMARLFKTKTKYYKTDTFLQRSINVSQLLPNIPFLFKSVMGFMPGNPVHDIHIKFEGSEDVPLQCDGEVVELQGTNDLTIDKSTTALHILTTK